MCVAGRLSYCRERKSSLWRSWCFCFSVKSVSAGLSFSSSSSSINAHTEAHKMTSDNKLHNKWCRSLMVAFCHRRLNGKKITERKYDKVYLVTEKLLWESSCHVQQRVSQITQKNVINDQISFCDLLLVIIMHVIIIRNVINTLSICWCAAAESTSCRQPIKIQKIFSLGHMHIKIGLSATHMIVIAPHGFISH